MQTQTQNLTRYIARKLVLLRAMLGILLDRESRKAPPRGLCSIRSKALFLRPELNDIQSDVMDDLARLAGLKDRTSRKVIYWWSYTLGDPHSEFWSVRKNALTALIEDCESLIPLEKLTTYTHIMLTQQLMKDALKKIFNYCIEDCPETNIGLCAVFHNIIGVKEEYTKDIHSLALKKLAEKAGIEATEFIYFWWAPGYLNRLNVISAEFWKPRIEALKECIEEIGKELEAYE